MRDYKNRSYFKRACVFIGGSMVCALTLAACGNSDNAMDDNSSRTARSEAARPSDSSITAWVREAFEIDPRVASGDIRVEAVDGIVTLEGSASNLLEKRYARLEANKIDGVRGVIDDIVVAPVVRQDADVKRDVELRLANNPIERLKDLEISVVQGNVAITGHVSSWAERQMAETMASEIRGVRSVTNDIDVDPGDILTDAERRDAIVAEINRDAYLTGMPITVIVENGFVTLEGTVGNAYEKERAESDAYMAASVKHVDNNLFVDWFEEKGVRKSVPMPSDEQLKQSIHEELALDMRLAEPSEIKVEVVNGRATLTGSVSSYFERRLAEQDARNVVGVWEVSDLLKATDEYLDDSIASGVTEALDVDYLLTGRDIAVRADEGKVTLTGTVDSHFQRRHAAEVASHIPGVRSVINEITVNSKPGYTDAAIAESITRRLSSNWKTRSVADKINVEVEDGYAVLSGTVDSWAERMEAEELARATTGVADVKDDVMVEIP